MRTNKVANIMEKLIYLALGCVLFILPFPRGLFFEKEMIPVLLVVYTIFVLWTVYKIIKKERLKLNSYLAIGVCILPVAYMLPTFLGYAANKTDAINYLMRYTAYLAVFIIASDMTKTKTQLKVWLYFIALSGLLTGLLGIDSLAGGEIGKSLGFNSIGFEWNRLYGVMQYANTAGVHYGMIFFVFVAIALLSDQRFVKVLCSGAMFIMITTLMLTVSRGAIILVPVIYLALLILLPDKEKKIEFVLTTIAPALITLFLFQPLQTASPIITEATGLSSKVWQLTIIGVVASIGITFVLLLLTKGLNKVSEKTYNIAFIVIMALMVIGVLVTWFTGLYTKIIPQELLDRFLQTGSEATSGRTDFYRDGLRVLKDNWLLGAGGGAWKALYRAYQSYDYGSSEAHNLLLQVWIETGIIGITAYIFMLLSALKTYIDCRKRKRNTDMSVLLLAITMYTIGHSMVDFDFSYVSIPIIIFTLFGALDGISQDTKDENIKVRVPAFIGTFIGTSFAAIALCFIIARGYAVQATSILINQEITSEKVIAAEEKLRKAVKFNPWNIKFYIMESRPDDADFQVDLNKLYGFASQLEPDNEGIIQLHYYAVMEAVSLSPKNPIINVMAAQFMINIAHDLEEGLKYMDKGLKYNPMAYGRYEEIANAYYEVGNFYLQQGDNAKAELYLKRVLELENEVAKVNERAIKPVVLNENTLSYIQKARELLG